jgi:hypothetical protein
MCWTSLRDHRCLKRRLYNLLLCRSLAAAFLMRRTFASFSIFILESNPSHHHHHYHHTLETFWFTFPKKKHM